MRMIIVMEDQQMIRILRVTLPFSLLSKWAKMNTGHEGFTDRGVSKFYIRNSPAPCRNV
jgi:hypothetical protein